MSHFVVVVAGNDVKSILAPYDENLEVDWHIGTPAYRVMKALRDQWVCCYRRQFKGETLDAYEELTLSLDKPTKEWWKQYAGERLDDDGNGLTRSNPNAKWDWYSIGGRWLGELILKKGKKGKIGEPGVFGNKPKADADVARICDIDWKAMSKKSKSDKAAQWDDIINPCQETRDWYKAEWLDLNKKQHLEMYGTKAEYLRRRGYWTAYALVTEKEWIAPGDMGWFGMSDDTIQSREAFTKRFVDTLKAMPKDTKIHIVDCHI
jgi:hypothetical protein